jgi:hypothetical protein
MTRRTASAVWEAGKSSDDPADGIDGSWTGRFGGRCVRRFPEPLKARRSARDFGRSAGSRSWTAKVKRGGAAGNGGAGTRRDEP